MVFCMQSLVIAFDKRGVSVSPGTAIRYVLFIHNICMYMYLMCVSMSYVLPIKVASVVYYVVTYVQLCASPLDLFIHDCV